MLPEYPRDFIANTRTLITKLSQVAEEEKLEVTFFMNTLLGTIITISEELSKLENKTRKSEAETELLKLFKDTKLNTLSVKPKKIKLLDIQPFQKTIKTINNINFFSTDSIDFNESFKFKEDENAINTKSYKWLLSKIRNSIAHQNVKPLGNTTWTGVEIWNINPKFGVKDFVVIFTIDELKKLTLDVVDNYLSVKFPHQ